MAACARVEVAPSSVLTHVDDDQDVWLGCVRSSPDRKRLCMSRCPKRRGDHIGTRAWGLPSRFCTVPTCHGGGMGRAGVVALCTVAGANVVALAESCVSGPPADDEAGSPGCRGMGRVGPGRQAGRHITTSSSRVSAVHGTAGGRRNYSVCAQGNPARVWRAGDPITDLTDSLTGWLRKCQAEE